MGNIQSETWFIVLSVVAGFIGIGGWAGNRLGYKHKFIIYARLIGLLAVVFIVVAYGIAIFRGRGLGLTQALVLMNAQVWLCLMVRSRESLTQKLSGS